MNREKRGSFFNLIPRLLPQHKGKIKLLLTELCSEPHAFKQIIACKQNRLRSVANIYAGVTASPAERKEIDVTVYFTCLDGCLPRVVTHSNICCVYISQEARG